VNAARTIAIVVEHAAGEIRPISYELAAAARELASKDNARVVALAIGDDPLPVAQRFAADTGLDVLAIAAPGAHDRLTSLTGPTALDDLNPDLICLGHTSYGWDIAPALAVSLDAACVTAVEGIAWAPGGLVLRRTIHGGRLTASVAVDAARCVITVQAGAFKRLPPAATPGVVTMCTAEAAPSRLRRIAIEQDQAADRGLDAADVIVAVGRGIGARENVELARRLAAAFPKGALAGSRPVCDAGWLPYARQVGQTGATVRPKVYLACGISGASQHIVGMRDSGFIVAINHDPAAPIFAFADVGVAEDVTAFLPLLTAESRRS
jgi:electron transfer flavoprotein alpha subunit